MRWRNRPRAAVIPRCGGAAAGRDAFVAWTAKKIAFCYTFQPADVLCAYGTRQPDHLSLQYFDGATNYTIRHAAT